MSTPHVSRNAAARLGFVPNALARAARTTLLCAAAPMAYPLMAHAQATEAATNADTLPNITVKAERSESATTEQSRSFAAKKATVGKTARDLKDIPQPVTVLTRELLDQRLLPDLHEVLQSTPGISVDYTDSERVTYHSRGYQIDALQIDGLTINQAGSSFIQPDTAVMDRIEVLRGSSGMVRGSGNPSAAVNMVRKRPTNEFQGSVEATIGSWDRRRLVGDISSPLNAAGTVRGRMVAVSDKKEFFQDAKQENRQVVYGVVEADLGTRTTLTASLQHSELHATGAWGNLPGDFDGSSLDLPRSTYLGSDWNQWNRYNQQAYAELQHRFDNEWSVKLSTAYTKLRLTDFKQTYFTRTNFTTNPYIFSVATADYAGNRTDQNTLNLTANGPFTLFGRKHELVFGAETVSHRYVDSVGLGNQNIQSVDIRNWNPSTSYAETSITRPTNPAAATNTRQQGIYATTSLSLADPLKVNLGARMSWLDVDVFPRTRTSNYRINREVTPYVGAVYTIAPNINAYASYTEIFTPQNFKNVNGEVIAPIRGEDYEAGLKGEFFGGKLNASLGLFRIENVGKAAQDTSTPNPCGSIYPTSHCYMADGKTRSEGWELELSGEITRGWQVMGGYTNTRTSYVKDSTAANVGTPLRSIDPRHMLKVFTSYKLDGAVQGLTVGGGVQIQSGSYITQIYPTTNGRPYTATQGGFAVYNAMLNYQFNKQYSLQLNANNLFDKVYYKKYTAAPNTIGYYYGDPRNVMLTLRAAF